MTGLQSITGCLVVMGGETKWDGATPWLVHGTQDATCTSSFSTLSRLELCLLIPGLL